MFDISNKVFGIIAIGIIAGLQLYAWYCGIDGYVFAFTGTVIGGIVGALLGFTINLNGSIKDYFKKEESK